MREGRGYSSLEARFEKEWRLGSSKPALQQSAPHDILKTEDGLTFGGVGEE